MMKNRFKDIPLTLEEVREIMRKENSKKIMWIGIAVSVITVLIGVIIWLAKKSCKDIEEHYEYFDDYEEDLDEEDELEEFDDDIYDDEEEVEYVKIKDFMNYDEDTKEQVNEEETEATDELVEEDKIQDDTNKTKKEN